MTAVKPQLLAAAAAAMGPSQRRQKPGERTRSSPNCRECEECARQGPREPHRIEKKARVRTDGYYARKRHRGWALIIFLVSPLLGAGARSLNTCAARYHQVRKSSGTCTQEYTRTHPLPVGLSTRALNENGVAMTLKALDGRDDAELHVMAVQVDATGGIKCDDELVE